MSAMRRFRESVLLLVALSIASHADSTDLRQYLRDHYEGKTFALRGFVSGDKLDYSSSGEVTKGSVSDDWTTNGFVTISRSQLSHGRVSFEATRLLVIIEENEFRFILAMHPGRLGGGGKPVLVKIEADLGSNDPSSLQVEAILSKIFLTSADSLSDLVSDYWKPCVPEALAGKENPCHFSREVMAVPGIAPTADSNVRSAVSSDSSRPQRVANETQSNAPFHVGHGIKPPKLLEHHEPEFSDPARAVKYQGTMTLAVMVDKQGIPRHMHILKPLGCGLDLKAVEAVNGWRFEAAEKDGQAVNVEIAVEVNFHLY